jgi:hypothetical protein
MPAYTVSPMSKPLRPVFANQNCAARPIRKTDPGEKLIPPIEHTN